MVRKRVDERIRTLLENGAKTNSRSFLVMIGDNGKDQVPNLHYILSKIQVKARPSVLWCYQRELGFSSHKTKRLKQIKKLKQRGLYDPKYEGNFDLFISSTNIRYLYYKDSEKILGQTFGMLVLQDFHSITPNLLARTIETVEGGGLIVLLLNKLSSLKQFYSLQMEVHKSYQSNVFSELRPRFNERFILSLTKLKTCLVVDDELNVLPVAKHMKEVEAIPSEGVADSSDFKKTSIAKPLDRLIEIAKTRDQVRGLVTSINVLVSNSLGGREASDKFVSITAGRGRGKSALLGLITSSAISLGLRNIFITSPSAENLQTVFEFLLKGLKQLKYQQHVDFEVTFSPQSKNLVVEVAVLNSGSKLGTQTVKYVRPTEVAKFSYQMDLLLVDEAAAIPLPVVRKMISAEGVGINNLGQSSKIVFLSSTINGYEGTGRSLSLKLLKELRKDNKEGQKEDWRTNEFMFKNVDAAEEKNEDNEVVEKRISRLTEIELSEPIRYGKEDPTEKWLNTVLCLKQPRDFAGKCELVPPENCELYAVDRNTLFSFHKQSEKMLSRIIQIYVSAHYKNSPDDLLLLADNPSHRLFVLVDRNSKTTSSFEILVVLQVSFEGNIPKAQVSEQLELGNRKAGDLVPWLISQQFQLYNTNFLNSQEAIEFGKLVGCRVVRIATNPKYFGLGYGKRAVERLCAFIEGKAYAVNAADENGDEAVFEKSNPTGQNADDKIRPRKKLNPLFVDIGNLKPVHCHYLSVSYGLTLQLYKFWSALGLKPVYLRQTKNELTGEHSCVMIRELEENDALVPNIEKGWLQGFNSDFKRRFLHLQCSAFRNIPSKLSVQILDLQKPKADDGETVDTVALKNKVFGSCFNLSVEDVRRLDAYSRNLIDYHMILDIVPSLAVAAFMLPEKQKKHLKLSFTALQTIIFLVVGIKGLRFESIVTEFDIPISQVLALFNKAIRKFTKSLKQLLEQAVSHEAQNETSSRPVVEKKAPRPTNIASNLSMLERQRIAGEEQLNSNKRKLDLHQKKQNAKFNRKGKKHKR